LRVIKAGGGATVRVRGHLNSWRKSIILETTINEDADNISGDV
jgi:hypothetical protein